MEDNTQPREGVVWRQSAVKSFASHFNKQVGNKHYEIDSSPEVVGDLMAMLLDQGFDKDDDPVMLEAALEYLENDSHGKIRINHPGRFETTKPIHAIRYAAERAVELSLPLMDDGLRPKQQVEVKLGEGVNLKSLVEDMARRGHAKPAVAVGLLLVTRRVDATKISQADADMYSEAALKDIYERCSTRTGVSDVVALASMAGVNRNGLPRQSFDQLVEDETARQIKKLAGAPDKVKDLAEEAVVSRITLEMARLYNFEASYMA